MLLREPKEVDRCATCYLVFTLLGMHSREERFQHRNLFFFLQVGKTVGLLKKLFSLALWHPVMMGNEMV